MIHYHGTPISGNQIDSVRFLRGRHAFVSFAHPQQIEIVAEHCQSFALDNGAFSAWKRGISYDFHGYEDFVRKWINHPAFDWCVIPDVIDGTEEQNDELLHSWPFPNCFSVPVWHLHESIKRFSTLCHSYPRVALGSSGQWAQPGTIDWWQRIHEALGFICERNFNRPPCKLHGLRMLNPQLFRHMPLSSADSTNVARNRSMHSKWNKAVYAPVSTLMRAFVIAERIEAYQSSPTWKGPPRRKPKEQKSLFDHMETE